MRLYASDVQAWAVVGERLLAGKLRLYTDRTGTLTLEDTNSSYNCMGSLRYTSSTTGTVLLRCSDGTHSALGFQALTETSGHGQGAAVSLAYGLGPQQARAWLKPPAGKQLQAGEESLRLIE
jgi:hypothetical protein